MKSTRITADLPKGKSTDFSTWYGVIQSMLFWILDDIDYMAAEIFLDESPSRSRSMKDMLGIHEDYFSAVPEFPNAGRLDVIRADLCLICRRPKAWITPM